MDTELLKKYIREGGLKPEVLNNTEQIR